MRSFVFSFFMAGSALANVDVPTDKLDEAKAQVVQGQAMIAPPSCYLWAEPNEDRAEQTEVVIKMSTAGKVSAAVLDTKRVDISGGEKKVKPYAPMKNADGSVNPEWASTYLASVAGPGGTASCLIWVSRSETMPRPPKCVVEPAEQSIKAGATATIDLKVEGETTQVIVNEKTMDKAARNFPFTPTSSMGVTISVAGKGGQSTCSGTIVVTQ